MLVINESYHQVGWTTGRLNHPGYAGTLIVKGTYDLELGRAASPAPVQLELAGDEFIDDDPNRALWYSSDFAEFKPRTDLLLVGHYYAPPRTQVTHADVVFRVGDFSKRLAVTGSRFWRARFLSASMSLPEPLTKLAVSYENSFGGPGYAKNPLGKGFDEVVLPNGSSIRPLPHLEEPAHLIASRRSRPDPAGFGPIPLTWPQRLSKAGTYDKAWLKQRWPWFPKDFDASFFNAAPQDQQLQAFLRGDEKISFENLHQVHQVFNATLPGIRVRCFYAEVIGAPVRFEEVPMHLDTLWVNPDTDKLVLVWRGVVPIRAEQFGKRDHVLVISEPLSQAPLPLEHFELLCAKRVAQFDRSEELVAVSAPDQKPVEESIDPAGSPAEQGKEAESDEALPAVAIGHFDAEAAEELGDVGEPEPLNREWCQERFSRGEGFSELDLSDVDLSGLAFPGASFQGALLTNAFLRNMNLAGADFTGAILAGADLTDSNLHEAILAHADLTSARLVRTDLTGCTLVGADLTKALLRGAKLDEAHAEKAILAHADLFSASLAKAHLAQADLSHSILHNCDLSDAALQEASMEKAWGVPLRAERANLTGLRASNAVLWNANFRDAAATNSIWQAAQLKSADFSGADLTHAEFEDADLPNANFVCAILRKARLVRVNLYHARMTHCDLFKGTLEKADLTGADVSGSNLYRTDLFETVLEKTKLDACNLKGTLLTL
jgi:uncharacterized protein YjbI with pentapeptide repeats